MPKTPIKKQHRSRRNHWEDRYGYRVTTVPHPGSLLAVQRDWSKTIEDTTDMLEPCPDVVNVGFLSNRPLLLNLEHVFYVRPFSYSDEWISFGYHPDPEQFIDQNKNLKWKLSWRNPWARPPRDYRPVTLKFYEDAQYLTLEERQRIIDQATYR